MGYRTVAHRSIVSLAKELEIGKLVAQRFESTVELVQDPWVGRYVSTMAGNVARSSDGNAPLAVKVVQSPQVNSVSAPGGFIDLNSGLLLSAENEDEIAGAIAHQVAHAATRSWASETTKMTPLQYAPIPPIFVPRITMGCSGFLAFRPDSQAVPLVFLKFVRQGEPDADHLGLPYMYKAGYDPGAYIALLRTLALPMGLPIARRIPSVLGFGANYEKQKRRSVTW